MQKQRLRPMHPAPQELRGHPRRGRARRHDRRRVRRQDGERRRFKDATEPGPASIGRDSLMSRESSRAAGGLVNSGRAQPRLATNLQKAAKRAEKAASAAKRRQKMARVRVAIRAVPAVLARLERKPPASLAPLTERLWRRLSAPRGSATRFANAKGGARAPPASVGSGERADVFLGLFGHPARRAPVVF